MSTAAITRPLPNAQEPLYRPYLQGLREHRLMVQHCSSCGHWQWPPREFCFVCHRPTLGWAEIGQQGSVYTYTVCYRAFHPWFKERLPYGIVDADLGQGIRLLAPYFDPDVEQLECGQTVHAAFDEAEGGITVLRWTRA